MKIGHSIDSNGFLTGDVLSGSGVEPDVTDICPNGFAKPKWDGTTWVEGITQEELDAIPTPPPTPEERTTLLQNAVDFILMNF